jgi:5-methylcytosine-specific restriction endonuclease McrA
MRKPTNPLKPCPVCNKLTREAKHCSRPSGIKDRTLYNSKRYKQQRDLFLWQHPLCSDCLDVSTEVHHTVKTADPETFFDSSLWMPLCKRCHAKRTKKGE